MPKKPSVISRPLARRIPLKVSVLKLVCVGFAGNEITFKIAQQAVFEKQADAFLLAGFAARLQAVNIIPARLAEGVFDERRTHDKLDLAFGHAGAQLINHFLGDDVALLNVDFVDAREVGAAAGDKQGDGQEQGV